MDAKAGAGLMAALRRRFEENPRRHEALDWALVEAAIAAEPEATETLLRMEASGGEPDVIGREESSGEILFCDCSAETPAGRRGLCYDRAALESRKENKPRGDALGEARAIGVELLTEDQYRRLQELGEFDTKTSSWLATPESMRRLGGALFGDRRYGRVFAYHNGAESYYAARGFRGILRVRTPGGRAAPKA